MNVSAEITLIAAYSIVSESQSDAIRTVAFTELHTVWALLRGRNNPIGVGTRDKRKYKSIFTAPTQSQTNRRGTAERLRRYLSRPINFTVTNWCRNRNAENSARGITAQVLTDSRVVAL